MVNRQRAQLILAAAILIGLTIVASAVLLNQVHASADVQSQQERQSLGQTEQIIEQLNDNLDDVFVANDSQEDLPYVEEDGFESAVEEFVEQYMNISTRDRAGFVDIEVLDSDNDGYAVWQNESEQLEGPWQLAVGQDNVTYLKLQIVNVNETEEFVLDTGGGEIQVTDEVTVSIDGVDKCTDKTVNEEQPLVIELVDGEGEIRAEGEQCESISFGSDFHDSNIAIPPNDDGAQGEIYVVYAGGNSPTAGVPPGGPAGGFFDEDYRGHAENVVTQPVYQITYQDSQLTYQTNVTAYGGEP